MTIAGTNTTAYDVADHLRTPDEVALYLAACRELASEDRGFMTRAAADAGRAEERIGAGQ